ncbi:hypothetical protein DP145_00715 [Clostridium tetani]|uniref:ATP-grasp domain-containing protein n=1 Tax=Clostridium tetani TaxID=1513 RepID=UPI00100A3C2F|nr:ATP-grasp domain-containing protein [Clostridium tetani]RXI45893.1 hypothetical protein DP126_06795 [Clostridium tetani]RXM61285.1 hypothetical protein DP138_03630 [Clostridium tetani]RXM70110.1 hypothetical protein DP145_00715 [Clostridium tetani]
MIGIVIGASSESIHAINCAKKMGVYVVALDGNSEAEGLKIADKCIVVDIKDRELVCDKIKNLNPTLTIPVPIGRYLTTTGYVNEYFNLKGIKGIASELCTDKYLFHKKLNERGLRKNNVCLVKTSNDYIKQKFNYPIIVKPRYGSGSREVTLVSGRNELLEILGTKDELREDFIIEEAIEGTEYGVDGAILNGEVQITLLRKKIITKPPARQCVGYISVNSTEYNNELLKSVQNFLQCVIKEINMDNCIFHADLIINDNDIFIIEISGRPSGHYLHNVFTPYVTDIDMIMEYIKYIKYGSGNFSPNQVKLSSIHYFNFENCVIDYVPTLKELTQDKKCNIKEFKCNIKPGDSLGMVNTGQSVMGRGYFIVDGETEEVIIYQIDKVLNSFKFR